LAGDFVPLAAGIAVLPPVTAVADTGAACGMAGTVVTVETDVVAVVAAVAGGGGYRPPGFTF